MPSPNDRELNDEELKVILESSWRREKTQSDFSPSRKADGNQVKKSDEGSRSKNSRDFPKIIAVSPIEIFCCYAHEDQMFLELLKKHLSPLQRQDLISVWANTDISPGMNYEEEINRHLSTSKIILLLISPDFMASDYCYSNEMKKAMEQHQLGNARVIPVILRPVHWQNAPFGKIEALPLNGKPVTNWQNLDEAFFNVVDDIKRVADIYMKEGATG